MRQTDAFWRKLGLIAILASLVFVKLAILDPWSRAAQGYDTFPVGIGRGIGLAVALPILGIGLLIGANKFVAFIDITNKPWNAPKAAFYIGLISSILLTISLVDRETDRLAKQYINKALQTKPAEMRADSNTH